jgi:NAD(P)-dependent dehydrogenase (short-subunit alcohol dehydrogenase family)
VNAAVVLGARNLGGAIARDLLADEVCVAAIARTRADLDALAAAGAFAICADAADEHELDAALVRAAAAFGPPDLIVNAVSASRPPDDASSFGGGALTEASAAGFDGWAVAVAQQAFVFLHAALQALDGHGGTIVQIIGAPARRVAAGSAAVRALAHAAAQEWRERGIHVALLIVDGIIESPKTARMAAGMSTDALVRHEDVVTAVRFLASQSTRGMTHELVITPGGGRWVP